MIISVYIFQLPSASSSTTTTSDEPLKTQLPLKLDEQTDGQFALPFNYDGEPGKT